MRGRIASAAIRSLATISTWCWILCAQLATSAQQPPATSSGQSSRSVWAGVYTAQQAKRGEAIYARECASCHGPTVKDGQAPPLAGEAFLAEWNGHSVGDLFERTCRTMPVIDPGNLSIQEYVDVLALILSANKFPAGDTELQSQTELLKQIRIEAAKAVVHNMPPR